jgi:hypothetical protein
VLLVGLGLAGVWPAHTRLIGIAALAFPPLGTLVGVFTIAIGAKEALMQTPTREPRIINPNPRYGRVRLIEPTTLGYLHLAAEVRPRRLPFLPAGRRKTALLARLKELARRLESEHSDSIERVTVFDAIAMPPLERLPGVRERAGAIRVARFDVVVLVETRSPAAALDLQRTPAYLALAEALRSRARQLHVLVGRNAKRVGDVEKTRPGTFLFNYFVAPDPGLALELWDYLAGWYAVETGLDNSTLLVPVEGAPSDYVMINHARWDAHPLRVVLEQLTKPSFRRYVLANLAANRVVAMPVLYRLA